MLVPYYVRLSVVNCLARRCCACPRGERHLHVVVEKVKQNNRLVIKDVLRSIPGANTVCVGYTPANSNSRTAPRRCYCIG
ncbi:MAG: hypothetical protein GPOALKHO_000788 [Sodalis sp.]|nr:MAG: hypothetical protein GPOALKHO_000788 [Sodalis sp.]